MVDKILGAFFLINYLHFMAVDCQCNFSTSLIGVWNGADRGLIEFENTTYLSSYTTLNTDVLPSTLDFICLEQHNNTYLLKATTQTVFGGGATLKYYLCIDLYIVNENIVYYYLLTEYNPFLRDYIYGFVPDDVVMTDVCSRVTTTGNFITMVRNGSIADSLININCPGDLHAVFDNVTIQRYGDNVNYHCVDTVFDVCTDKTKINITYGDLCVDVSTKTLSNDGLYSCIHSITDGTVTYLAVWNYDNGVTNPFSCFALQRSDDTVLATESPKFCSNTSSPTSAESGGVKIVLTDITKSCEDSTTTVTSTTTTTSTTVDSTNLARFWGLMAIPAVVVLIAVASVLICRLKKTRHEISLDIFGSSSIHVDVSSKPFFDPNVILRAKMNSKKPKMPLSIFTPIFESKWIDQGTKRLTPAPKVAPLYTDVIDD